MSKVVQRGLKYVIWSVSLLQEKAARVSSSHRRHRRSTTSPVALGPWVRGGFPPLPMGDLPFLRAFSSFVRVCVLFRKTRRRWLSQDGIRFSAPSPPSRWCIYHRWRAHGGVSLTDLAGFGRVVVFGGSAWIRSLFVLFVCLQVGSFRSTFSVHR